MKLQPLISLSVKFYARSLPCEMFHLNGLNGKGEANNKIELKTTDRRERKYRLFDVYTGLTNDA